MNNDVRSEFKLKNPPEDAISAVKFVPGNSPLLLVSSWDSTVRLYDTNTNLMKHRYSHNQRPVLDCAIKVSANKIRPSAYALLRIIAYLSISILNSILCTGPRFSV